MKRLCEKTPDGKKTAKMLEVELRLGRTLEEDFQEYYVQNGWGQQRLANRWGVRRNMIFHSSDRNRSRAWVEILKLPVRRIEDQPVPRPALTLMCEACGEVGEHFDRAHWIADRDGGSIESENILRLCPNCHRKLDRDDPVTVNRAKEVLLFREAKRVIEATGTTKDKESELLRVCTAIISRRI